MMIDRARSDVEPLLEASPSLRCEVTAIIARETVRARRAAQKELALHDEQPSTEIMNLSYLDDHVQSDWRPNGN